MNQSEIVKDEDTKWITCSNCNKNLLRTPDNKNSGSVLYKLYVDCPFCGDKSFDCEIKGPFMFIPAEGVQLKQWKNLDNNRCKFTTSRSSK